MNIGDVVRLKSGGPMMTVVSTHSHSCPSPFIGGLAPGEVACLLSTSNGVFRAHIPEVCLDAVDSKRQPNMVDAENLDGDGEASDKPAEPQGPRFFL